MTGDVDGAAVGLGGDLPLDRLDVLDGGKVEILAPDEGPQPLHHVRADRRIAGDRARLDHCGALPVLPVALVVLLRSRDRERQRCRAHVGPELEIGPVDAAIAGPLAEQGGEVANQPVKRIRGLAPPAVLHPLRVEQHEQVELARIGELACAECADAEHGQPAHRCRLIAIHGHEGAARRCLRKQLVERAGNGGIGEAGQGFRHLVQRPGPGNVGQRDSEQCPPLGRLEPLEKGAAAIGAVRGTRYLLDCVRECRVRAVLGHQAKLGRLAGQPAAKRGAVAENAVEESASAPIADECVGERFIGAAEHGCHRQPGIAPGARAFARGRLGANRVILEER